MRKARRLSPSRSRRTSRSFDDACHRQHIPALYTRSQRLPWSETQPDDIGIFPLCNGSKIDSWINPIHLAFDFCLKLAASHPVCMQRYLPINSTTPANYAIHNNEIKPKPLQPRFTPHNPSYSLIPTGSLPPSQKCTVPPNPSLPTIGFLSPPKSLTVPTVTSNPNAV